MKIAKKTTNTPVSHPFSLSVLFYFIYCFKEAMKGMDPKSESSFDPYSTVLL